MRLNVVDLLERGADDEVALVDRDRRLTHARWRALVATVASALAASGVRRRDRVAIVVDKTIEAVAVLFGTLHVGAIAVPLNPGLRPAQLAHALRDAGPVRVFATTARRAAWHDTADQDEDALASRLAAIGTLPVSLDGPEWDTFLEAGRSLGDVPRFAAIDRDPALILYTSGSTGLPKGVVLSHRNLLAGAESVASYLGNRPDDRILAALPLSFDAGLSQLTTAFAAGARVVLHQYLLPQDCLRLMAREGITGLTAVPPLWLQLSRCDWPAAASASLRYFASTGGRMPAATLSALRSLAPAAEPFLMYGLTEAFRSTYLPPQEAARRPDSIGRAIPGAEILVLRPDGTPCEPDEPGELVHLGATVTLGYWNDPARTAERFRPVPRALPGLPSDEIGVWSGDIVRRDAEGFLYFIGRRDEMIKTSGHRVSPTEVEEILYADPGVRECAAVGVPDEALGQAIVVVVQPAARHASDADDAALADRLRERCRRHLPGWMIPRRVRVVHGALPRNPNGKIDRLALARAENGEGAP